MQRVFVLDGERNPLDPCHPARARALLKVGKAAVFRRYLFTIILKERHREDSTAHEYRLKLDPGSRTTGMALVREADARVVFGAELTHRGLQIKNALLTRRQLRHGRRSRKTRYRPARFDNRQRPEGWLAPSLMHRLHTTATWVKRLYRWCPITAFSMERVKFDTQQMQNPEISGVEYQQGELAGYEVREYLLEKWGRKCAYCRAKDISLEIEHIIPKSRGGSNRVSNLTLACRPCNQKKGSQTAAEFGYPHIAAQAKQPWQAAAAVNATRWALYHWLVSTGLPVEVGTGARTKFNRIRQGYPKTHWLDAACVGESGAHVYAQPGHAPLLIKADGRQSRLMCRPDQYGFPRTSPKQGRVQRGFQTGDMVQAKVPGGKKAGKYIGRVWQCEALAASTSPPTKEQCRGLVIATAPTSTKLMATTTRKENALSLPMPA